MPRDKHDEKSYVAPTDGKWVRVTYCKHCRSIIRQEHVELRQDKVVTVDVREVGELEYKEEP